MYREKFIYIYRYIDIWITIMKESSISRAELVNVLELIEYEVFEKDPKPKSVEDVRKKYRTILYSLKISSFEELKTKLGI